MHLSEQAQPFRAAPFVESHVHGLGVETGLEDSSSGELRPHDTAPARVGHHPQEIGFRLFAREVLALCVGLALFFLLVYVEGIKVFHGRHCRHGLEGYAYEA